MVANSGHVNDATSLPSSRLGRASIASRNAHHLMSLYDELNFSKPRGPGDSNLELRTCQHGTLQLGAKFPVVLGSHRQGWTH